MHDRQAQAAAAGRPGPGGVPPHEPLEHLGQQLGRDARAVVGDADDGSASRTDTASGVSRGDATSGASRTDTTSGASRADATSGASRADTTSGASRAHATAGDRRS